MKAVSEPFLQSGFCPRYIRISDTNRLKAKLMRPRADLRRKRFEVDRLRTTVLHESDDSRITLMLVGESQTFALAARIAKVLKAGMVIYLRGDLGSGKTTMVRGILEALGYTERVKSPTYTLVEPYEAGGLSIRHFDLYRMQDEQEWESAGFRDEFDGTNILFIEWPDKAPNAAPPADMEIELQITATGRTASIHAKSDMGRQCLRAL